LICFAYLPAATRLSVDVTGAGDVAEKLCGRRGRTLSGEADPCSPVSPTKTVISRLSIHPRYLGDALHFLVHPGRDIPGISQDSVVLAR
jgi:hypothetical protein